MTPLKSFDVVFSVSGTFRIVDVGIMPADLEREILEGFIDLMHADGIAVDDLTITNIHKEGSTDV